MLIGYMRVSSDSDRQSTDLQRDALLKAGADARNIFEDRASGARDDRTGLGEALKYVNPGDVFVVWKLDRLGRSLTHLISIVNGLRGKRVRAKTRPELPCGNMTISFAVCICSVLSTSHHCVAISSWH